MAQISRADRPAGASTRTPSVPVYVTVAGQVRTQILDGTYPGGTRLPTEVEMGRQLGVARTTVREALRLLASEGLVATTRGATGGTVVLELDHRHVMNMLEQNMRFLVSSQGCSEHEMDEVRELLEVSAAWLAASRRSPIDMQRLWATIPEIDADAPLTPIERQADPGFHRELFEATGNRLLHLFAQPVSEIIYSFFHSEEQTVDYYRQISHDHRLIAKAIEARDPTAAQNAMAEHLRNIRTIELGHSTFSGMCFD
jgi:GntR family transcriptional repressor for pyruvate dehydrogenase complex